MSGRRAAILLAGTALFLIAVVALALRPYGGNPSALLHMHEEYGRQYDLPPGIVLYRDGGYDGMLYYQLARDLPALLRGDDITPPRGRPRGDRAYRGQRMLLPVLTWLVSAGDERRFPQAILAINLTCLLVALSLAMLAVGPGVHAATVVLNPAALIGLLYACTEPLTLALTTAFFTLWHHQGRRLTVAQTAVLALAALARETTVLLVLPLCAWLAWHGRWRQARLALASLLPWALWQLFLFVRLDDQPFSVGSGMISLPLSGALSLVPRLADVDVYVVSSAVFLIGFLGPVAAAQFRAWRTPGLPQRDDLPLAMLTFLTAVVLCLDAHVWHAVSAVGRVMPALYVAHAMTAAAIDDRSWRLVSAALCAIGTVSGVGVALSSHPFTLT
ncbi:MAG TPA: hypothetical protein VEC57_10725 [Candidatus Limnocylindrales bacterium]|nr:hypothetical protein [Candidatus Limnocylindrales bacterium]